MSAENIEDEIAELLGKLVVAYGVERAREFLACAISMIDAADREATVIHIPARLRLVVSDHL